MRSTGAARCEEMRRLSWLSGGFSQRQVALQAARSFGQPRPSSHFGPRWHPGHIGRVFHVGATTAAAAAASSAVPAAPDLACQPQPEPEPQPRSRLEPGACSSNFARLPGFGIEAPVRVCERCLAFESDQLPSLLAGDVFIKPGAGAANRTLAQPQPLTLALALGLALTLALTPALTLALTLTRRVDGSPQLALRVAERRAGAQQQPCTAAQQPWHLPVRLCASLCAPAPLHLCTSAPIPPLHLSVLTPRPDQAVLGGVNP
jgi:hypothetical protein